MRIEEPSQPLLTWALLGVSVLLTLTTALAPSPDARDKLESLRTYARLHPQERPPPACEAHVDDTAGQTLSVQDASSAYERLCTQANDAKLLAGARRAALAPPGSSAHDSALAWLLHPLVFANAIAALLGWLLLWTVVGPVLEPRWGTRKLAVFVGSMALLAALTWRMVASDVSQPWTGGQGWLTALVAALVISWPQEELELALPHGIGPTVYAPGWLLGAVWLVGRGLAFAMGGTDRAGLAAEFVAGLAGAGATLAMNAGLLDTLRAAIDSQREKRQAGRVVVLAGADPPAAERPSRPDPFAARTLPAPDPDPEPADVAEDETVADDARHDNPAPVAAGVKAAPQQAGDPNAAGLGWLVGGSEQFENSIDLGDLPPPEDADGPTRVLPRHAVGPGSVPSALQRDTRRPQ